MVTFSIQLHTLIEEWTERGVSTEEIIAALENEASGLKSPPEKQIGPEPE